ncbi:MAG: polysaccharide biosynthesis tyrosine autokinase [Actinobacteria bacterium]|nr:polysaccharide biosynthesis tyrosine autokinase [Actinomycetota bacterium]
MQQEPAQPAAPDLREYLAILRYRKWTILFITALVVASALFFSYRQTPIYESETRVLVRQSTPPAGVAPTFVNLDTERALVDSAAVASLVQEQLDLPRSPEALLGSLEVSVETNTEILAIRYSDPDPLVAQRLAQGFAQAYTTFRRQQAQEQFRSQAGAIQEQIAGVEARIADIQGQIDGTEDPEEQNTLSAQRDSLLARLGVLQQEMENLRTLTASQGTGGEVVQPANLPSSPASPALLRNGMLALAVGLALGIGLAFLRERLDERLRGREDLEAQIGAPVLATVPRARTRLGRKRRDRDDIVTLTDPKGGSAEAYRTLRTNVQFLARTGTLRVIGIVSPAADEGKTTTAANLAVSLAHAGKRVIVVSCDLRKPRLHRCFGIPNDPGLTSVLSGMNLMDAIQKPKLDNLRVLASGPTPPNPAELIGSDAMERMLETLQMFADFVILDTPPLLAVSDGVSLASRCDGVLMVADARTTARGALAHAREQLEQVGAKLIGGVLNNFDPSRARYYSHYHGSYYASYRPKDDREEPPPRAEDPKDWDPAQMWS